jgi:TRAP-type C4-dicarboxylate transport system substrate-binding protein
VYRADLPRTLTLVVALLLIAMAPTSIIAREFRVTDNRSEDDPTVEKLRFVGRLVAERCRGRLQIRVFHSGLAAHPIDGAQNNSRLLSPRWSKAWRHS